MKNFLIIADQDRGKSHFIKNEIIKKFHNRPLYAYDINLEYTPYNNRQKGLPSKEDFLNTIPCTVAPPSKILAIFEEATSFFSRVGVSDGDLNKHIYRRFHTQNINVFVFHGLNFVPTDILPSIDFIVLFRTSDDPDLVKKKFKLYPKIVAAFDHIQKVTKGTSFNRELKTYPDEYSKKWFHYHKIFKTK